jgi:hypothetical protein
MRACRTFCVRRKAVGQRRGRVRDGAPRAIRSSMNVGARVVVGMVLGSAVGCGPVYEAPPPLPPPPVPAVYRTPAEEWSTWEASTGQTEPTPPEPSSSAPPPPPASPRAPGEGPLPPLPKQGPKYAEAPPPEPTWVRPSQGGSWVYTRDYGWLWVPAGAGSTDYEGVPYTYLYTPRYGWTWYVSPWGPGYYAYGGWVVRPYRPVGWMSRPWVAHPHVVVRLGGHAPRGRR